MAEPIMDSQKASKGAFAGIKKVGGILLPLEVMPITPEREAQEHNYDLKERVKVSLADAEILEMEEGEQEPELKDGIFSAYYSYAEPGKKPTNICFYVKGFLKSFEAIKKSPRDFYNQHVVLEQKEIELFTPRTGADAGKPIKQTNFVLSSDQKAQAADPTEYVAKLVVGCNDSAAYRKIAGDGRAKGLADMLEAAKNGTLDAKLGMVKDAEGNLQMKGA